MKTAKKFLKEKGLKDTLYNVKKDDGSWIKGGLSKLLDEYHKGKVNELKQSGVISSVCPYCESSDVGYNINSKQHYCNSCNFAWAN